MKTRALITAMLMIAITIETGADYKPGDGPLMTHWGKQIDPEKVLPEYPRPQMMRGEWLNLNGLWQFSAGKPNEPPPIGKEFAQSILVPFPVESALSGVMEHSNLLWYRRVFNVDDWIDSERRVLLHFGAVDWETGVWINGKNVGSHRGGYDPFTFDITEALKPAGEQEIIVWVSDPTSDGPQPRGKQVNDPQGIWYTPTTGIWQTVWLEPVTKAYIRSIKLVPNVDRKCLIATADCMGARAAHTVEVCLPLGDGTEAVMTGLPGRPIIMPIENPKLWSPDSPHLYDLRVRLLDDNQAIDEVYSYFGMRKIALGPDSQGITRLMLNGRPLFQIGVLDQGFWPDGLYTAPSDEALRYDIEMLKQLGFNLARKHVKIEPARWYYWCDKLGLLVWQDMPSGDKYIGPSDPDIVRTRESKRQFEYEMRQMILAHYNNPSIVMWVIFNEGWGQYDTERMVKLAHALDPSRLIDSASGWADRVVGDVHDIHAYPGPAAPRPETQRAAVLGEFGGLGLPLEGHTWTDKKNWGYRNLTSREQLTEKYEQLLERLRPLIGDPGLCAAVYTQVSDVETEVNGLLTYDRAVLKPDVERIRAVHEKLHLPPPTTTSIVPTSRATGLEWRYTTKPPAAKWFQPSFDDGNWKAGPGGFGTDGTPGAVVRTVWNTNEIWLRRGFELSGELTGDVRLMVHHDEDVELYINGILAAQAEGYTVSYELLRLTPAGRAALQPGQNTIAIHCKQTGGGQYIDAGLVEVKEQGAHPPSSIGNE